jgi:hypothetical protein
MPQLVDRYRVPMLDHTDQDDVRASGKARPDLEYALYRALNMNAETPAAEDITQRCLDHVLLWEAGQGRRKRSTADIEKVKDCTAAFLGAMFSVPRNTWFRTAMGTGMFTGKLSKYSWRTVHAVRNALLGCGLMEKYDACALVVEEVFDSGKKHVKERRQTRFQATAALYSLADATGVRVNAADGEGDFAYGPPAPLRLLTSTGKPVDYGDDPRAAVQVRLIERLNEFWVKHTIEGTMTVTRRDGTTYTGPMIHRGFRRDFNCCDVPVSEYDWNLGGRLYSPGETSYQQASQADRIKMKIDGGIVVEIDVSTAQLSALLGAERPDGDLYQRGRLAQVPRAVVKKWVTLSIGQGSPLSRWHPGTRAEWEQDGVAAEAHRRWTAKAVGELVLNEYPTFATELGKEDPGLWARLMYLESTAIVATLGDLMAKGIPALPVHDSIIIPADFEGQAVLALVRNWEEVTGARPFLTPVRPFCVQWKPAGTKGHGTS